jgi:arylformamidase
MTDTIVKVYRTLRESTSSHFTEIEGYPEKKQTSLGRLRRGSTVQAAGENFRVVSLIGPGYKKSHAADCALCARVPGVWSRVQFNPVSPASPARIPMKSMPIKSVIAVLLLVSVAGAQNLESDLPYAEPAHERQVLDIYTPDNARNLPVVFWIHGGGWQTGDKTSVQLKPRIFTERGYVFVSTNYRLLPHVEMEEIFRDVAKSLGWVHKNIALHGGDPTRIFVMGHSAGAQLAALMCIDERYLRAEGVPFEVLKGCVPVDGDTYDLPAMIVTAELRQTVHGLPLPTFGHRVKFGNDPKKHIEYSAVTHVAKGKGIPPFLILHVSGHPDVTAQARRLGIALQEAEVPVKVFGAPETTHRKLNADLGVPDDPATRELYKFLDPLTGAK